MQLKTCKKCKKSKVVSDFYKNKKCKGGIEHTCKICRLGDAKENYALNKEAISKRKKEYRYQNIDACKEREALYRKKNKDYQKKYRKENKSKNIDYQKKYRDENKSKLKKSKQKYYEENKQKVKESIKRYRKQNKEKVNKWYTEKRKKDPLFKMKEDIRSRVRSALKGSKSKRTQEIIGCSWEQLYLHLNLDNFENPSHDHIIPLSWAETEEELYALARWENLQGMELIDNISKNNKHCCAYKADYVLEKHPNQDIIKLIISRTKKENNRYVKFRDLVD